MSQHPSPIQAKLKIPHEAIVRAPGLLPMMYKTSELADDLGVDQQIIIRWAKNGAPHRRDGKGHIWIHGQLFAHWIESQRKSRSRKGFPADHGYCFRCRKIVKMEAITERRNANLILLTGICAHCGGKVNRGSSDG
jgi:hypothetical protein